MEAKKAKEKEAKAKAKAASKEIGAQKKSSAEENPLLQEFRKVTVSKGDKTNFPKFTLL